MKTLCPHCGGTINPAAILAVLARGIKKKFSKIERLRRFNRLAEARKKRWPK